MADVCVQMVGVIQLCEQVAHETPPEQDVPDSLNPKCALRWAHSEKTNRFPPRLGKAKCKEARSKVNGTESQKQRKHKCPPWPSRILGRTPTPAKDPHLILASLIDPSSSEGPHFRPFNLGVDLHIEARAPLGGVVVAPDPDQHVPSSLHVGGHGDLHPVALVDQALCGADDAGVGRVREGFV